jgi:hypothetical protein
MAFFVILLYNGLYEVPTDPMGQTGLQTYRIQKSFVDYFGLNWVLLSEGSILRHLGVTSLIIIMRGGISRSRRTPKGHLRRFFDT